MTEMQLLLAASGRPGVAVRSLSKKLVQSQVRSASGVTLPGKASCNPLRRQPFNQIELLLLFFSDFSGSDDFSSAFNNIDAFCGENVE